MDIHILIQACREFGLLPPEKMPKISNGFFRWGHNFQYSATELGADNLYIKDWVSGEEYKYFSKKYKDLHPQEKIIINERYLMQKEEFKKQKLKSNEECKRIAAKLWEESSDEGFSQYAVNKKIKPRFARYNNGNLIVPMLDENLEICNIETIYSNSTKRPITGGTKKGLFHFYGENRDVIYICEGYATAMTVHSATGYAVATSFGAGNLVDTFNSISQIFPRSRIIFALDDDSQKTNSGLNAVGHILDKCEYVLPAFKAKKKEYTDFNDLHVMYGLDLVKSQLEEHFNYNPNEITRYNNLLLVRNRSEALDLEALFVDFKIIIPNQLEHTTIKQNIFHLDLTDLEVKNFCNAYNRDIEKYTPDWKSKCEKTALLTITVEATPENKPIRYTDHDMRWDWLTSPDLFIKGSTIANFPTKDGTMLPCMIDRTSARNTSLILENCCSHMDFIRYNSFSGQIEVINPPIWQDATPFRPHTLDRVSETYLAKMWFETWSMRPSDNVITQAIVAFAMKNEFDPVLEYFTALKWDGKPRLDNWLITYANARVQPVEYVREVGRIWLMGAVARVVYPGTKFDTALILEGPQGIQKSTLLKTIATLGGENYFSDNPIIFDSKDTLITLQGKLVVEMAELVSLRKQDIEAAKNWISQQIDEFRPPYGSANIKRPRRFVIAGSHNPDGTGIFKDTSGNRRFLPVECGYEQIKIADLERDKDQLWAEAYFRYVNNNEQLYLTPEIDALAKIEQESRLDNDSLTDDVIFAVQTLKAKSHGFEFRFRIRDVFEELMVKVENRSPALQARVKKILFQRGFREIKATEDGQRLIYYTEH